MDLNAFATAINRDNTKNLLPQQQKTRSYSSKETVEYSGPAQISLIKFKYGEEKGEWLMKYIIRWPAGPYGAELRKSTTTQQIKLYVEKFLEDRSQRGDNRFISIKTANDREVEIKFEIEDWFDYNFKSARPKFDPPATLYFYYRQRPPMYIATESPPNDFSDFVGEKFEEWLEKKRKLRNENKHFRFLKRISSSMFMYSFNPQKQQIRATLKQSVILGSLAAFMYYNYQKEVNPKETEKLKRKLSSISGVDRLDKYIKRL